MPRSPAVTLVRPDHLGDVLFLGPAVARLRDQWPAARITLMVGPWSRPIAERLPQVDHVTTFSFPWYDRRPKGAPWRPYVRLLKAARALQRDGMPDVMFVMRPDDYWSAWAGAIAGVPVRIAHDDPSVRPFATHVCEGNGAVEHGVAQNIRLVEALTAGDVPPRLPHELPLAFIVTDRDRALAGGLLAAISAPTRRKPIAVHPGSGTNAKTWRTGAWAAVVERITSPDETVVLTGGEAERALTAALAGCVDRPVIDLAGRTDIGTLAAVLAECRLVLGPDSGPLHLAVAVGTPTVHLFGPADAARFGPWGPAERHRVVASSLPCAPCGTLEWPDLDLHPCVRTIRVDEVVRAARSCGG